MVSRETAAKREPTSKPAGLGRTSASAWKKGQSGNPGGRPKLVGWVRELAQAQTEKAILTLVQVMGDKKAPHTSRVAAAQALLDRGWGKPAQPIGGTDDLPPIKHAREMTDADLLALAQGEVGNG